MNTEALFLFLILLLSLVLCSFLGGNCGNEGFTNNYLGTKLTNGTKFYGENGSNVTIINNTNGTQTLQFIKATDKTPILFTTRNPTDTSATRDNTFYGPSGATANIIISDKSKLAVKVQISTGTYYLTQSNHQSYLRSTTNYDNYNHYHKNFNTLITGTTFYGETGGNVIVNANSDGTQHLKVTLPNSNSPMIFTAYPVASSVPSINVPSFTVPTFTIPSFTVPSSSLAPLLSTLTSAFYQTEGFNNHSTTFYGPNGATATVINTIQGEIIQVKTSSGNYKFKHNNNITSTQYYGSTGYQIQPQDRLAYQDSNEYQVQGVSKNYNNIYDSTMPPGIPKSQIPQGKEDLYILKTQIVPPVCPACPACERTNSNINSNTNTNSNMNSNMNSNTNTNSNTNSNTNTNSNMNSNMNSSLNISPNNSFNTQNISSTNKSLPQPVLNNFSSFGM
jgi:hypothetical protein